MCSTNVQPQLTTDNHSAILQLQRKPLSPGLQALVRMLDSYAEEAAANLEPRHFDITKTSILAAVRRKILDRPLPEAALCKTFTANWNASLDDAALASCLSADTDVSFVDYEFWNPDKGGSPHDDVAAHTGSSSRSPEHDASPHLSRVTPERFFDSDSTAPSA